MKSEMIHLSSFLYFLSYFAFLTIRDAINTLPYLYSPREAFKNRLSLKSSSCSEV